MIPIWQRAMHLRHTVHNFSLLVAFALLLLQGCSSESSEEATSTLDGGPDVSATGTVLMGQITGAIGPVTKDYVHRVVESTRRQAPMCIVFTMDTPGGLDASMRSIIKDILSSPVPVVVFVYPSGGRAASAGALITLSSHVAAMAPSTNIGAAHPVPLGQGKMDEEMMEKVTNDAAAFARGLAKQKGRDLEWAENIVRESISSTAEEALEIGVIDLIANDVDELLEALNNRTVDIGGREVTLQTAATRVIEIPPSGRERFLARISDPNIAYLLMLLGIFGIFFELQNPGAVFPGVIGGISIILAFFALQLLPVNFAGVALVLLGIMMFILEIKIPSGGVLTVGGVVSMLIGSIMFIDSPLPFMRVSLTVIIPAVIFTALFFVFAMGMALRAQRLRVTTGERGLVGEKGVATTDVNLAGSVFVHGEHWNAKSDARIGSGAKIEVESVDGLTLKVKSAENEEVT